VANELLTLGGGPSGASTISYLFDSFTDTNGTALNAHTMDIGSGWTYEGAGAAFTINASGRAYCSGGSFSIAYANAGVSDCTLTCTYNPGATASDWGVIFRVSNIGALWMAALSPSLGRFEVWNRFSSWTLMGSSLVSIPGSTDYTIRVVLSGTSIVATLNGANTVSVTSSSLQSQTLHGLASENLSDITFDNFRVTS